MDLTTFGMAGVAAITVICYPVSYTHLRAHET